MPQVSLKTHMPEVGMPSQLRSEASKVCTKMRPTSRRTHSSKMALRKRPNCSGSTERSETRIAFLVERLPVGVDALDHRDELHPVRADLVAQEAVDLQRIVAVDAVHRGQHVELDAVLLQQAQPAHHLVEGGPARPCRRGRHRAAGAARRG